jgi:uncharacterized membrane protein
MIEINEVTGFGAGVPAGTLRQAQGDKLADKIRLTVARSSKPGSINGLLLTSVGFSGLLLTARMVYTGTHSFGFLVWNLFLAAVPYFFSSRLLQRPGWIENPWKFAPAFVGWLVFIPNSFYMLTDLFHLFDSSAVPLWYDLLLIVSFAWNALLLGILSVRHMEKIVVARWPGMPGWVFLYPVMALNALGVYIGRYLRYNSWDVLSDPFGLAMDIVHIVRHPLYYKQAWGMIGAFSFFLVIMYTTIKRLSRAGL